MPVRMMVCYQCSECEQPIREGEKFAFFFGGCVCEDCIEKQMQTAEHIDCDDEF